MPQRRSYSPPSNCSTARSPRLTSSWDEEDPSVLRIVASLAAWSESQGQATESVSDDAAVIESDLENSHIDSEFQWNSTDKHRALLNFVIKKTELQKLVGPESARARRIANMWCRGHLHFVLSAPRASYARWRMKMAPKLVQPEDGLEAQPEPLFGILRSWVGNTFFAHEALRRSPIRGVGVLRSPGSFTLSEVSQHQQIKLPDSNHPN